MGCRASVVSTFPGASCRYTVEDKILLNEQAELEVHADKLDSIKAHGITFKVWAPV